MQRKGGRSRRQWFAVHCRTAQERSACERLELQGFSPFLPLLSCGDRIEPLFPGYLFVRFNPARKSGRPIRSTRGVIRLVSFGQGQEPSAVPDELLEELRKRSASSGAIELERPVYRAGQSVRISSGPFAGLLAKVMHQDPSGRLSLLFEAMGRVNRFSVMGEAVEAA